MTLGHQLAAMDKSARSKSNGMAAKHKLTTAYRIEVTPATGDGGEKEEKKKK